MLSFVLLTFIFFSWFVPLFLLGVFPSLMYVDLPSRRVINYLFLPVILLASFGLVGSLTFLGKLLRHFSVDVKVQRKIKWGGLGVIFLLVFWNGTSDFRTYYTSQNKFQDTVQIYQVATYLDQHTKKSEVMLKDHTVLTGDNWMKVFLLRGYNYFLSRTYDYKYLAGGTHSKRDQCPREMLIVPESFTAEKCYRQTQTNYVILRPGRDDFLFWRALGFNQIYSSDAVAIFKRK